MNKMRNRWKAYWETLGTEASGSDVYELIRGHMLEPHRFYHTFLHLAEMLDFMGTEEVGRLLENPASFAWKIWFHDLVYQIGSPDNERISAEIAAETALNSGLSQAFAQDVHTGILATRSHQGSTPDDRLLITADLAILAAPKNRFAQYCRGIRREYEGVCSPEEYRVGRLAWAEAFNRRDPIFPTEYGRSRFEALAHSNLDLTIRCLRRTTSR